MRLRQAIRHHPIQSLGFALALAVTLFFAVRLSLNAIYWADPAHRDQAIEGWMTPGYVAHSWKVPRSVMLQALEMQRAPEGPPPTLAEIAQARGMPLADLVAQVEAEITAFRAGDSGPDR